MPALSCGNGQCLELRRTQMEQTSTSCPADPVSGVLASLKRLSERASSELNALSYAWLCVVAATAAIVANGTWTTPALDVVWQIATDITRDPFPNSIDADWLLTSWLTPALAWLVGATATPRIFALFCGGLLASCYVAMCIMYRLRFGEPAARILVLVLATSPLATVLLTWIGYSDPLSVTLATTILVLRPLWLRSIFSALLAANHAEQAMVLLAVLLLLIPCVDDRYAGREGWRLALALMAGGLGRGPWLSGSSWHPCGTQPVRLHA
jgi:hypothetical protein